MPTPRHSAPVLLALAAMGWVLGALGALGVLGAAGPTVPAAPSERGEPLAIIVHQSNPADNLTMEELRRLCLGEHRRWPNNRRVTIALREPGQAERETVLREVFGMTEAELARHFLQATFKGESISPPKELSTAAGVRRFVFNVPGAIGFVRLREVDATVKVISLDGLAPTNANYRLTVATSPGPAPGGGTPPPPPAP